VSKNNTTIIDHDYIDTMLRRSILPKAVTKKHKYLHDLLIVKEIKYEPRNIPDEF
jgi:hypothetical protein